ncbi:MAG TPA: GAF domain-containing protein [Solirubrobacteraceae bacterium]|nr:GAF domain-containing protein [Solirubrobacteraceae bacterium]
MDQSVRGVVGVVRAVLDELDLDVVLGRVLAAARDLTGARYAALGVLDESRTELGRFLALGVDEQTQRDIGSLPRGRGVLGEVIRHPVPLRLDDVASHPQSYGFPSGHPKMRSFLGVPIIVAGETFGNLYLTDKQGAKSFTDGDQDSVELLAAFAGVAIDHARRYTNSEQARLELQRAVAAFEATVEISRALGGQTDLQAILELIAKRGRALVGARLLVIELLRDGQLVVAAGAGEIPEGLLGTPLPLEESVAGAAIRTGRTQRLADELNRSRYELHGLGRLGVPARDALVVPLVFRNETFGALVALDPLGGGAQFAPEPRRLLEAFATSAAAAVATARSAAAERRRQSIAATEAERGRWARELHDETLQALANLRLVLSAARRSGRPEQIQLAMNQAIEQLESDIASLRALISDLRPAALDQLGLEAAVDALADRMRRAGVEVDVSIELDETDGRAQDRMVPELETTLYRLIQEALTNATKHGDATRTVVEVSLQRGRVRATVRDNGRGFDPTDDTEGFGLLGMSERVELLDGTLTIESAPGSGTTIRASLPVRRRSDPTRGPDRVSVSAVDWSR